MEIYSMFMDRKTQYCLDFSSSKLDLQIQYTINQNINKLFWGYQADSKVYMEKQRPRIANTILKKGKVGELILPDFKTY